jgi:hypothetical protein
MVRVVANFSLAVSVVVARVVEMMVGERGTAATAVAVLGEHGTMVMSMEEEAAASIVICNRHFRWTRNFTGHVLYRSMDSQSYKVTTKEDKTSFN